MRKRRWVSVGIAAVALAPPVLVWGVRESRRPPGPAAFRDVAAEAGIRFQYDNDASAGHRLIETTGGGVASLDYDNDGRLDLFAVQGGPAPGSPPRSRRPCALFRNRGGLRFDDVTRRVGLAGDLGYAQGVSVADYDNDGWRDLLITAYGGLRLFRNERGQFREVTQGVGFRKPDLPHWYTSAAWADYDRDGDLDLFVCRYVYWFLDSERRCFDSKARPIYCTPTAYEGNQSVLLRNDRRADGSRQFFDTSAEAGLDKLEGRALGAAWLYADPDLRIDLFVANDMAPNWLFRNLGQGRFRECGGAAGVAVGPEGVPLSGMGVACSDYNGDGREDLFVVNFSRQPRSYYLNFGGVFRSGQADPRHGRDQPFLAFGVEALDYDLDGDVDLIAGNGHINQVLEGDPGPIRYRQRQQLLRNNGSGEFEDGEAYAGHLNRPRVTRGLAVGDFDDDGRPDAVVSGPHEPLALYRNVYPGGNWLGLRLEGRATNRDAIGARVTLVVGGLRQTRVVRSGSSYASCSDHRLLFGLGRGAGWPEVRITWPSGREQHAGRLAPGQYHLVREAPITESNLPASTARGPRAAL